MLTSRLALGFVLSLVASLLAAWIGSGILRAPGVGHTARAMRRFGVWWIFVGADNMVNQVTWLSAAILDPAPPLLIALLTYVAIACIGLMLWGLASHLVFLLWGRPGSFRVVTAYYVVQMLAVTALVAWLMPTGVKLSPWGGEITYSRPVPAWAELVLAIVLLLPLLVGALAYGTLYWRTEDRAARRRIAALSLGIAAWFAGTLVIGASAKGSDAGTMIGFLLGIGCMAAIARAYSTRQPRALRPEDHALQARIIELV